MKTEQQLSNAGEKLNRESQRLLKEFDWLEKNESHPSFDARANKCRIALLRWKRQMAQSRHDKNVFEAHYLNHFETAGRYWESVGNEQKALICKVAVDVFMGRDLPNPSSPKST